MPVINAQRNAVRDHFNSGEAWKNCHPGLALDKLINVPESQQDSKEVLPKVIGASIDDGFLGDAYARRQRILDGVGAIRFNRTTAAPMSLHLARAGILENAGICLHRTYGFAYIPGTGLKGMARAYAETIWLPAQEERTAAQDKIDRIFGWADTPDRKQMIKDGDKVSEQHAKQADKSGAIVFHDAWPTKWPKLIPDILTCHHGDYYSAEGDNCPPGDWESPNMVSFLAVEPGTEFEFALSTRLPIDEELFELAKAWLNGALTHLGAGAKTNAGYGVFQKESDARFTTETAKEFTLTLTTPGFLAGGLQQESDCQLRGATLRGLLRWWWRTIHAGDLSVGQLRVLEATLWGSSSRGGAIAIGLEPEVRTHRVARFDRNALIKKDDGKQSEIAYRAKLQGSLPPRVIAWQKVAPGLTYISYGMSERDRVRHAMLPGARWKIRLSARDAFLDESRDNTVVRHGVIPARHVLKEAICALFLLCEFGGVGSKCRKGFGSLHPSDLAGVDINHCLAVGEDTRQLARKLWPRRFASKGSTGTASLRNIITFDEDVQTVWSNPLGALHMIGYSLALFCGIHAHKAEKAALGLPRKIRTNERIRKAPFVTDRFASPWHLSLHPGKKGLRMRFVAFPSPHVPLDGSKGQSVKWLTMLRNHLWMDLRLRNAKHMSPPNYSFDGVPNTPGSPIQVGGLSAGQHVQAHLLEEKTKKGGWKAEVRSVPNSKGPIVNSPDVPVDKKAGDMVELVLNSPPPSCSYRWPRPDDKKRKNPADNLRTGRHKGPAHRR